MDTTASNATFACALDSVWKSVCPHCQSAIRERVRESLTDILVEKVLHELHDAWGEEDSWKTINEIVQHVESQVSA
jgi:hypothetical protein